jgi:hypothetical protein
MAPTNRPKPANARKKKKLLAGNGRGDGRRTPAQLARQERVFALSVIEGKTTRQIAVLEGIDRGTVIADLRHESARRAEDLKANREFEIERALSFYDEIAAMAVLKSKMYDGIARAGGKVVDHSLDAALKARERKDKILGIDAPTRIDVGLATLLEALEPPADPKP